jgi:2-C-methyl-D-erythritol 4-phosphate cytidylyltransferase
LGGKEKEKIYYVVHKKEAKLHEEKAGRQYADDMTPAKAAGIRVELIEGRRLRRKDAKRRKAALKKAEEKRCTIGK